MRNLTLLTVACAVCLPFLLQVAAADEAITLRENVAVGREVRTDLHLVLRGRIKQDDREETVAGQAKLVYPEKTVAVGDDGLAAHVIRFYEDARAKFVLGNAEDSRQLRPDVRLAIGKTVDNSLSIWSPSGPFDSDELELIEDVLDTTRLPGLLPAEAVKVGDKWTPTEEVQRRLCDYDRFITSTIECSLESADQTTATIKVSGKVQGLIFGSDIKSNVEGTLTFDRAAGMITEVNWKQIDARQLSPVSPAGAYEATIVVKRSASQSSQLTDGMVGRIDLEGSPESNLLIYEDPSHRYRFVYDRQWHLTLQERDRAIMRRLNGVEMICQLNITVLGENANIAEIKADDLQQMMLAADDIKIEEIIKSEAVPTDGDFNLRLVTARGNKGKLAVTQRHFIARNPGGRQILLSFLTEPTLEEKIGEADIALVQSLEFPGQTASNGAASPK